MVTTLSTRTSVLGVTNPTKGAFKHGSSCRGVAATSLSGPLLSRSVRCNLASALAAADKCFSAERMRAVLAVTQASGDVLVLEVGAQAEQCSE
jgi:hypothetical protein